MVAVEREGNKTGNYWYDEAQEWQGKCLDELHARIDVAQENHRLRVQRRLIVIGMGLLLVLSHILRGWL